MPRRQPTPAEELREANRRLYEKRDREALEALYAVISKGRDANPEAVLVDAANVLLEWGATYVLRHRTRQRITAALEAEHAQP